MFKVASTCFNPTSFLLCISLQIVNPAMSGNQEYKYFYEDEVYRITKKGTLQFGMVVENAEFASSDESEDEEESPLKAGQVRVSWYPAGREEVVSDKKVHLADRSLMPGDVVR